MSDKMETEIFGLMTAAQDQQAAVQTALARLAAQKAALKEERRFLAETLAAVQNQLILARRAAEEIGPELQRKVEAGIRSAVADKVAQAVASAAGLVFNQLSAVVEAAGAVETSLRRTVGWLTWRLLGRLGALVVGLLALMVAGRIGLEWWTDYSLSLAQAKESVLEAKIAGLEDTRDTLERAGAKAGITKCGSSLRLCIRVNEEAGAFGDAADYRIIRGY